MRTLLIFFVAVLFAGQPAFAAGPAIGPLCIDGVTATLHPELASPRNSGVWMPVDYVFDKSQVDKALVVVFDRPITSSDQFETCAAIQRRMVASGAQVTLSGRVRSLKLSAFFFSGPAGNGFQIDPGKLVLILGRVESGARPLIGGTIDFRGAELWIGVTRTVVATAEAIKGEFDVEAYNRNIKGAHLNLGGLAYVTDLRPVKPSNVSVRLDLGTGQAALWAGRLAGQPNGPASGNLSFPFMTMNSANLGTSRIEIAAADGKVRATFANVAGTSSGVSISNSPLLWKMTDASLTIGKAEGDAKQTPAAVQLDNPELTALSVPTATASLESAAAESLFRGKIVANYLTLAESKRSGTSDWTAASSPVLKYLMPAGISRIKWSESGTGGAITVSGSLDLPKLSFGGMEVTQPLSMTLAPTRLSGDVVIPVKVNLPSATGSISFLNGDQSIGIEGRLDRLAIDGKLIVSVPTLSASRFEAQPGKVNFAVGAAVAVSPVIAGTKPNFLNAEITATNSTDIKVAESGSSGLALLSSDLLVLGQPVFRIGDNGTAAQATVDLHAVGSVKLQYDLAAQKIGLAQAKLVADNVNFSLLGSGDKVVDLGGTLLTNPIVTLSHFILEVDRLSPIQVERADLDTLSVTSAKVEKTRPLGATAGMTYSGILTKPLTLGAAHANRAKIDDDIALSLLTLKALDLGIRDASVDFGSGIALAEGTLDLSVDEISETSIHDKTQRQYQNARIAAGGKIGVHTTGFSINDRVGARVNLVVSGPDEALNGVGTVGIGAFTGNARTSLQIGFDCKDTHELDVDMEANFLVGGVQLNATMHEGKISGEAAAGPIAAAIHSTGGASCNAPSIHHLIAEKGKYWTDGICSEGLKFYHCRWESPEVGYSYHITLNVRELTALATLSNPHVYLQENGNVRVCNIGVVAIAGVVAVGGYTPGPETNYPGLDNIVSGIIQLTLEPMQTVAATSLGNVAGWLVTSVGTPGGNAFCIGRKL